MARRAQGFTLRRHGRTKLWYVRFTWQGRRFDLSTGTRDESEALSKARKVYVDAIAGNPLPRRGLVDPTSRRGLSVIDAGAEWLASIAAEVDPLTLDTYERYLTTLYHPHFETVAAITTESGEAFARARLAKVQRGTVLKELSGLRGLLRWVYGEEPPPHIRAPQRKATGHVVFDRKVTELAPATVRRFLLAVEGRHHAREYFRVMYETGLRPATLAELSVPEHYTPSGRAARGARAAGGAGGGLRITGPIDKARFGRDLPITPAARRALDLAAGDRVGLIFGRHRYQDALDRACARAGLERFTPYDLRHAMGTHRTETTGNLPGVAYLMGHKNTGTTSKRYVHPSRRAALAVLKKRGQ